MILRSRQLLVLLLLLAACHHASAPLLPRPVTEAVLEVGTRFLDSMARERPWRSSRLPTLLASMVLGSPTVRHSPAWLRYMQLQLTLAAICPPPESECFKGQPGYLFKLGRPTRGPGDTVSLNVSLGRFFPDESYVHPPGLGHNPLPPGQPAVPAVREDASDWTLTLLRAPNGRISLIRAGREVASDGF